MTGKVFHPAVDAVIDWLALAIRHQVVEPPDLGEYLWVPNVQPGACDGRVIVTAVHPNVADQVPALDAVRKNDEPLDASTVSALGLMVRFEVEQTADGWRVVEPLNDSEEDYQ